jgi:hypothetical protein
MDILQHQHFDVPIPQPPPAPYSDRCLRRTYFCVRHAIVLVDETELETTLRKPHGLAPFDLGAQLRLQPLPCSGRVVSFCVLLRTLIVAADDALCQFESSKRLVMFSPAILSRTVQIWVKAKVAPFPTLPKITEIAYFFRGFRRERIGGGDPSYRVEYAVYGI